MKETTLGVAIITKNAAPRLAECLAAVAFADAIVVIDGGSTDGTVEIAQAHGARVLQQTDWPGFGPQKNRALDALDTDWILSIDADEIVSPELAAAIRAAIAAPAADVYAVDRLSSFCGHWIHHSGWYPDWIPRLFKRGAARFSDDLVHERLVFEHTGATADRQADALLVRRLRNRAAQAGRVFDSGCAATPCRRQGRQFRQGARDAGRGHSCALMCCGADFSMAAPAS